MERRTAGFDIKDFDSAHGSFAGWGAVFGNVDSHKDVIEGPGAFADSLAYSKSTNDWPIAGFIAKDGKALKAILAGC